MKQAGGIYDEIVAAFQDVPRPDRCAEEDFVAYDEAEDLDYLVGKTWLDIAADGTYLTRHCSDQFVYMTRECLFYLFPGYLLGAVNHEPALAKGVLNSLFRILNPSEQGSWEKVLFQYFSERLTPIQKKAVAHWIELQLERDKELNPELYDDNARQTRYQAAFVKWQQWG